MATHYLEFEKPIADLEAKIEELSLLSTTSGSFETEIEGLRRKADQLRKKTYANLDPWMKTQVARHPQRPHLIDYIDGLFTKFSNCEAIGSMATTRPSLEAWPGSGARPWSSWATKRATTPSSA